jgi:hypothetical protein
LICCDDSVEMGSQEIDEGRLGVEFEADTGKETAGGRQ